MEAESAVAALDVTLARWKRQDRDNAVRDVRSAIWTVRQGVEMGSTKAELLEDLKGIDQELDRLETLL